MFKSIHGLAPHYLSNGVTMHVDIHGYDTRSAQNMDLYIPRCTKWIYKRSILYKGSPLWNKLPPWVKGSTYLNGFKHNFGFLNGWIHPEFKGFFICTPILCLNLMLLFYQFCLHLVISGTDLSLIMILLFSCMTFIYECVYICSLYLCILLS